MLGMIELYIFLLLFSGIVSIILAIYVFRTHWLKKKVEAARIFSFLLVCISLWSFGSLSAIISLDEASIYFWEQYKYIGIFLLSPTWTLLALSWTGRSEWIVPRKLVLFYIVPIIGIFFVFTDQYHHLIWTTFEYVPVQSYILNETTHGPIWWIQTAYAYVMILMGTYYIIMGLRSMRLIYKKQAFLLLIGALFPWVANIIYAFGLFQTPLDFTPAAFLVTGIVFTWGFSKFHLIEVIPIAKESVFNHLNDPIFVFDARNNLVELNPSAEKIFKLKASEIIGKNIKLVFSEYPIVFHNFIKGSKSLELALTNEHGVFYFDVDISPLKTTEKIEGHLFAMRDITKRKVAEIALKESEEKFRTYTESSTVGIMIYQDDKWVYANPEAERISEYSIKELSKMNIWENIHPDYQEVVKKRSLERQKGESPPSRYDIKVITKSGKEKWVDIKAEKIEYNEKLAVLVTISDITDRKIDEKIIKEQLTVIKSSIDGIAILDEKSHYSYMNDAFAKMYGYSDSQQLLGKAWDTVYNEEMISKYNKEIVPIFTDKGQWRGEAVGKKKDGSLFDLEITLTLLDSGGFICVSRDITKQKMVMKELHDAHEVLYIINKDLERKVKQRTEEIERLVKQKGDFINQLGHDLKTPLTPMMVLLPMLKKKVKDDKDLELFDVIIRNTYYMKDLVNKTINLAKLNSDKIKFTIEPISLSEEADNIIISNQLLLEENKISVENNINKDSFVDADQLQIQEVFNNLITNAVKYSHEKGGKIILSDELGEDNQIVVSVQDDGIGMTDEQIKMIFNEFYKADDSRHNLDSSGLGLNICMRIIDKHGGKIWAESEGKGKGSAFKFSLKKSVKKPVIEVAGKAE